MAIIQLLLGKSALRRRMNACAALQHPGADDLG